jgi:hypothetical protein
MICGRAIEGYGSRARFARCIEVEYTMVPVSSACSFFFYIPKGNATAHVNFRWQAGGATHSAAALNEAPDSGWVQINMGGSGALAANVSRISFTDNNGESGTKIGWGAGNSTQAFQHGVKRLCSLR